MAWLVDKGIGGIVTLTESSLDRSIVLENDVVYKHIPVVDMAPPSIKAIIEFLKFSEDCLKKKKAVLVHCTAGLGRTGTMLSCYLVKNGIDPFEAIRRIRQLRPGSVETLEQEMRILEFADSIGLDSTS
jgi:atypical dual specificity phosphatase